MSGPFLFKVLSDEGKPCHGGNGEWPLPKGKRPGAWLEIKGEPQVCSKGLHLVSKPMRWWKPKARLFLAEADPLGASFDGSEKAAFKRARLIQEVTFDWPYLPMFAEVAVFLVASALSRDPNDEKARKYLSRADLYGANLSGADLSRANLSGANLYGANRPDNPPDGWKPNKSGLLVKVETKAKK